MAESPQKLNVAKLVFSALCISAIVVVSGIVLIATMASLAEQQRFSGIHLRLAEQQSNVTLLITPAGDSLDLVAERMSTREPIRKLDAAVRCDSGELVSLKILGLIKRLDELDQ